MQSSVLKIDNHFYLDAQTNNYKLEMQPKKIYKLPQDKKSGEYPGAFKGIQKSIKNNSEAYLYLMITNSINKLNSIKTTLDEKHFILKEEELENLKAQKIEWTYAFDYVLNNLKKYGVETMYDKESNRMIETKSYNEWYKNWSNYFEYLEENPCLYSAFIKCRKEGRDLSFIKPDFNKIKKLSKK